MMGMHGEAWVNHAIQEADLLIALGMRFDDRVTGKLSTFAVHAKKIHAEIDPSEINKNVKVDVALLGDVRETLEALLPPVQKRTPAELARSASARSRAKWRAATSSRSPRAAGCSLRTCCTICGGSPTARRWWSPTSASTRCGRRSTTSTIGRAR